MLCAKKQPAGSCKTIGVHAVTGKETTAGKKLAIPYIDTLAVAHLCSIVLASEAIMRDQIAQLCYCTYISTNGSCF